MALISVFLDIMIESVLHLQLSINNFIYAHVLPSVPLIQVFIALLFWLIIPILCVFAATIMTEKFAPLAAGSGIPQIKTLLRGFEAESYLSFTTMIIKILALIFVLGSRLPLGREGPFVHIGCCLGMNIAKHIFKRNDYLSEEIITAACAVGIACNFSAPIGGVLFAIEVTTNYFAVKNYWRAFYAAICGSVIFQITTFNNQVQKESLTALFKTNFPLDFPFHPKEMILFIFIGSFCGLAAAIFIRIFRNVMKSMETGKSMFSFEGAQYINRLLRQNCYIYAVVLCFLYNLLTFPQGFGQFIAGKLTVHEAIDLLFDNETWVKQGYIDEGEEIQEINNSYQHPMLNVYFILVLFLIVNFLFATLSVAIKAPCGVFMPVFLIGATFGRLVGESMSAFFPNGIIDGTKIIPGGYAIVGAASLAGGVTRTISSAIIVFELTGQISHIVPVMVAVLISNGIASMFENSFYDTIIYIRKLPFLPDVDNKEIKNYEEHTLVCEFMEPIEDQTLMIGATCSKVMSHLLQTRHHDKYCVINPDGMFMGIVDRKDVEMKLKHMEIEFRSQASKPSYGKVEQTNLTNQKLVAIDSQEEDNEGNSNSNSMESTNPNIQESTKTNSNTTTNSTKTLPFNQKIFDFNDISIDPCPPTVTLQYSLHQVHRLFSVLRYQRCYVLNFGKPVGIITLFDLQSAIKNHAKKHRKRLRRQKYTRLRNETRNNDNDGSLSSSSGPKPVNNKSRSSRAKRRQSACSSLLSSDDY